MARPSSKPFSKRSHDLFGGGTLVISFGSPLAYLASSPVATPTPPAETAKNGLTLEAEPGADDEGAVR